MIALRSSVKLYSFKQQVCIPNLQIELVLSSIQRSVDSLLKQMPGSVILQPMLQV